MQGGSATSNAREGCNEAGYSQEEYEYATFQFPAAQGSCLQTLQLTLEPVCALPTAHPV